MEGIAESIAENNVEMWLVDATAADGDGLTFAVAYPATCLWCDDTNGHGIIIWSHRICLSNWILIDSLIDEVSA